MDRASILGDAIDYMKELLQRINDLHSELESSSLGSTFPPSTTFHTMIPTTSTLPSMVKEERCPSNVSIPNNQSPKVLICLMLCKIVLPYQIINRCVMTN